MLVNGDEPVKEISKPEKTALAASETVLANKTIIFLKTSIFLRTNSQIKSPQDDFLILCAIFEKITQMSKKIIFGDFQQ